ncbi:MAG: ATP-dependent helicase RecG [Actinomycetota bacterium]|nr:ATP-dependent helicase RecG [Actinomycetota bacterium]
MVALGTPLKHALGDKTAKALAAGLDLHTVEDLLRHYPRRYAQRGELTDLSHLPLDEQVTVVAKVSAVQSRPMRQRRGTLLEVTVTDGHGTLKLTFFNQAWRQRDLQVGRHGLFAGKVGVFNGVRQLTHPDYQIIEDRPTVDVKAFADQLIPVYPASAAMASWSIAQSVRIILDTLDPLIEPLPDELRERRGLLGLSESFRRIHRPADRDDVRRAQDRLRFDEAFGLQVILAQRRAWAAAQPATPRVAAPGGLLASFDARLPFTLTAGQQDVAATLTADLARPHPMHRLLQGEVGSGKTVVALRAMLAVVDAGGQAALLAPTEVLAQQHHRSVTAMLGPLAERGLLGGAEGGTRVALLTGSQPAAVRRRMLLDIASGEAGIVIGTHALIQDTVDFFDLGLVVVDEQHRFGVEQRDALRSKSETPPHLLVMTATPIPRTVAMTVFGDLDVSTLTELPLGRTPITTHVVPSGEKPHFLERAWERVREEVAAGHQAYVVCPRIGATDGDPDGAGESVAEDEDEGDGGRRPAVAVLEVADLLADGPMSGLRLAVLHGRLAPDEKDDVMRRFAAGDIDVLVATTIIEVGVDVANATAMVVLDADRFGVSQLHQLRGRIGRGSAPGLCLLVTEAPEGTPSRERLDAVAATLDGFELSRVDLAQRREGDVLGASQSGRRSSLKLLAVIRDEDLIVDARSEAERLVADDPDLNRHLGLRSSLAALVDPDRAGYLEKA